MIDIEIAPIRDYQLTRDGERSEIKRPTRYAEVDIIHYTLFILIEPFCSKQRFSREAMTSADSKN